MREGGARGNAKPHKAETTPAWNGPAPSEDPYTVTPLACLFDRFNALALSTAGNTAGPLSGKPGPARRPPSATPAGAGAGMAAPAPCSPLGPARRVRATGGAGGASWRGGAPAAAAAARGPRSSGVSFGTPAIHEFSADAGDTPARATIGRGGGGGGGNATPLWSNAGHTPYSLADSSVRGPGFLGRGRGIIGVTPVAGPDFDAADWAQEGCQEEEGWQEDAEGCENSEGRAVAPLAAAAEAAAAAAGESAPEADNTDEQQCGEGSSKHGGRQGAEDSTGGAFQFRSAGHSEAGTPVFAALQPAGGCEGTPTMFTGVHASTRMHTPGTAPPVASAGGGATPEAIPFALPTPAPKTALKHPGRVPHDLPRPPGASTELKALLRDQQELPLEGPSADHGAAERAARGTPGPGWQQALGSLSCLSPVRVGKKTQGCLGADAGQVLTPVRRSARKATGAGPARAHWGGMQVTPLLEATQFCYKGNPVMTPGHRQEDEEDDA